MIEQRSAGRAWLVAALIAIMPCAAHATCVEDSTVAELATGSGCYVGDAQGGELLLAPTLATEFSGASLPSGWTAHLWSSGSASVGGNVLSVSGHNVFPDPAAYAAGVSLEFEATFAIASLTPLLAQPFQTVGFGSGAVPFNDVPLLAIGTYNQVGDGSPGYVNALVWSSGASPTFQLHPVDGLSHRYRIDWDASTVSFWVDGNLIMTQPHTVSALMRPAISSFNPPNPLVVDWMRLTPYAPTTCAHESAVIDSGAALADWTSQSDTGLLPAGTSQSVETRTGANPTVDGTWSAYQAVSAGVIASPRGRYLQYRVTLATSDAAQTPELADLEICYVPCTPTAEVCDNQDNDCDDQIDEANPGGNLACNTGGLGVCAAGTTQCSAGAIVCNQNIASSADVCDALDNDCDGAVDEGNPGGNLACNTGALGVCAAGTTQCDAGSVVCQQNVAASGEVCDSLDNDCDGAADDGNPGGNLACNTGGLGVCSAGTTQCSGGAIACNQDTPSGAETCDNLDNDCDGQSDESDPGGGGACATGNLGICAAGVEHCLSGAIACVQTNTAHAEVCNTLDDDCDGSADDGNPGGGAVCSTGQPGVCGPGVVQCSAGSLTCQANLSATPEVCNGLDDNCNVTVDEGNPGGGAVCATGLQGVCAAGTTQCQSPTLVCVQNLPASTEICANLIDEDCSGQADEAPCDLCTAANTVSNTAQTKITVVKLKAAADLDKVIAKGTFVLPAPAAIAPLTQPVTVRVSDAAGAYWDATLPIGAFTGNASGSSVKFKDSTAPFGYGGLQTAYIKVKSDAVTAKYLFKGRDLNLPAFAPGTGTVTVKVGARCFVDSADTCAVSTSGAAAKCK
ncbi:MAG: MopE-related protein [Candidatus Binatia bacterium]